MIDRGPTGEQLKQLAEELVNEWIAYRIGGGLSSLNDCFNKLVRVRLLRWDPLSWINDFVLCDSSVNGSFPSPFSDRRLSFIHARFAQEVRDKLQKRGLYEKLQVFQRVG